MAAPGQAEQLATLLDLQRELALETDVDVVLRRIAETASVILTRSAPLANYAERGSLGLLQMREAARLIGARLVIDSSPGQSTRVRLRVPTEGRTAG